MVICYHRHIFRYKQFDHFLETVKNTTTVLILVFKEFYKSIPPLISVLYAKGYHDFTLINFRLTVPKNFTEGPFCVSESFCCRKMLGIRKRVSRFSVENFLSHSAENFRKGTLQCFKNFGYRKILCL